MRVKNEIRRFEGRKVINGMIGKKKRNEIKKGNIDMMEIEGKRENDKGRMDRNKDIKEGKDIRKGKKDFMRIEVWIEGKINDEENEMDNEVI